MVAGENPWSLALTDRPGANYFLYIYALLTKLVQSRWMDMGQVLFRVFKSIKMQEKKTRPTFSHIH